MNTIMHTPIPFRALMFVMALLLPLVGCGDDGGDTLPFYRSAELTPEWIDEGNVTTMTHRIADFSFVDQDGGRVSSSDFDGKIYVANFFFVRCTGICPSMRSNMAKIQAAYRDDDDVLLLSHSVMPASDSVPVLRNYAQANGVVSGKWHLVTGSRDSIYTLARDSYFADLNGEIENDFLHTETFFLIDGKRRIRGVYNGTLEFDVKRLIEDIAVLRRNGNS